MIPKEFIEKAIEGGWGNYIGVKWCTDITVCVLLPEKELEPNDSLHIYEEVNKIDILYIHKILLDPLAWQAVGKVMGWGDESYGCTWCQQKEGIIILCPSCGQKPFNGYWRKKMHAMIDALCDGNSIEQFLETI